MPHTETHKNTHTPYVLRILTPIGAAVKGWGGRGEPSLLSEARVEHNAGNQIREGNACTQQTMRLYSRQLSGKGMKGPK